MNEFRRWELFQQQLCVLLLLQLVVRCLHECVMTGGRAGVAHNTQTPQNGNSTQTSHRRRASSQKRSSYVVVVDLSRTRAGSSRRIHSTQTNISNIQLSERVKRKEKREIHNQIQSQTPTKQNPTRFETIVKQKQKKKLIKLSSNEHVNLRIYRSCT